MAYHSAQQAQLALNISNADTPDYKAKDVVAPDFKKMAFGGVASGGAAQKLPPLAIVTRNSTFERNPSGNNVSIEEEMAKAADNQQEYQKVLNLYRKTVDMFKIAIGKNSG